MLPVKKIAALLLLLLSAFSPVMAQRSIRLTTNWEFIKQDLGGIWEAVRPAEPLPIWEKVTLPHCFNSRDAVDPSGVYYQGPGWYRTQLTIDNPYTQQGRTLLHFEGAGQKTDVYVYTTRVAAHLGGYDEWTVDITDAVAAFRQTEAAKRFKGKVPITIRCDNSRDVESIPSRESDFCVYGGIYRYLDLVYVPSLSIDKVFASAEVDKDGALGKLNVKARFYNPGKITNAQGSITVTDPQGKVIAQKPYLLNLTAADEQLGTFEFKKPMLWSPANPNLYTVSVTIHTGEADYKQTQKIGFRNFEFVDNGPFMLNGKRLLLRGTHLHADEAGVAAAMTEDMIRPEMQMIKDMGANFIRLGHYQQSQIVLNLCDSLGLLVWEETPWCRGGLGGEVYKNEARSMLTNMIEQHYNHPSIIIWSLGNENDWPGDFENIDKQQIRAFMQEQNDLAHKLDPSRKTAIRRCDFCKDIVDVYSPTLWAGWYVKGSYKNYKDMSEKAAKTVKHFLHVEWGGDSQAGRFAENPEDITPKKAKPGDTTKFEPNYSTDGDWSESYICNLFDWTLKEQETMPWLTGTAFWTFKDFATPLRPDNPVPFVNQKGVVTHDRTPKESYYVVQSFWADKPMVHIFGHTWPIRWGNAGEQKLVKVYSNCDEAELFVNSKSYGIKKRNSQDFPAAGLHWMVAYNKGNNHLKVIAKKGKTTITDEIDQQYQTDKWGKPAKLLFEKTGEKDGIATVQVKLLDANNVPCLDAANWLNFSLAGDGVLLDDLGTPNGSRRVQASNGRAQISIDTRKGKSVVSVASPGLASQFVDL